MFRRSRETKPRVIRGFTRGSLSIRRGDTKDVLRNTYQHPPTGCLETLTGGFWTPVVTRKHLLEGAGRGCFPCPVQPPGTAWDGFRSRSSDSGAVRQVCSEVVVEVIELILLISLTGCSIRIYTTTYPLYTSAKGCRQVGGRHLNTVMNRY